MSLQSIPVISVIVPCYNVEKLVDRCIDSLVNQTIGVENIEIILVNDASVDNTYEKLLVWEKKYPESVMVITYEENLRQGGARNIGLSYASADWICFVDSDDWCEPDMLETLYFYAKTGKYDRIIGKLLRDDGESVNNCHRNIEENQEYFFDSINGLYFGEMPNIGVNGILGGTVASLVKREILIKNNISFPEKLAYEDNYWGNFLRLYTSSVYIVDRLLYHYYINPESTVVKRNQTYILDRLKIEMMLVEKYIEVGAFDVFHDQVEFEFIQRFFCNTWFMLFTRFDSVPHILMNMKSIVLRYFPNYQNNIKMNDIDKYGKELLRLMDIIEEPDNNAWNEIQTAYLALLDII